MRQLTNSSVQSLIIIITCGLVLALYLSTINNSFFWDTVQLGSKHATFYFNNHFSSLWLPTELDSGHIPAFGLYLAAWWKCLGRSLWVSHLAMLPFVIGIIWQIYTWVKSLVPNKYIGLTFLLAIIDPSLLAQLTLVSPDVVLVFFFLLGINAILSNHPKWIAWAIFGLFLISMRGMMVAFALALLDFYCNIYKSHEEKNVYNRIIKRLFVYLPSVILFVVYNLLHFKNFGWLAFHNDSPWSESFESVGWSGVLYNFGILIWRMVDFGRVAIWICLGLLMIFFYKANRDKSQFKILAFLCLVLILVLCLFMVWAEGLQAHRYLLPVYLSVSSLCVYMLFNSGMAERMKYIISSILAMVLISGNLWIYPPTIAQGWDSSLAALPYYKLRLEAIEYLEKNSIPPEDVLSFFPNLASFDHIDLNGKENAFNAFDDLAKYVFYSNVFNVKDSEHLTLQSEFHPIKEFRKGGVYIQILQRN